MSDLNKHIEAASQFQAPISMDAPLLDQTANTAHVLELAARRAADVAAAPKPETISPLGAMPIPN